MFSFLINLQRLDGLPKSIKELPTAKELEKPKDLNDNKNDKNCWYTSNFKENIIFEEDLDHKAQVRKL